MITPLDIENKKFSKQMMNGYNVDEVDEFLDQIMQDYETNYKELASMKTKVDEFGGPIDAAKIICKCIDLYNEEFEGESHDNK